MFELVITDLIVGDEIERLPKTFDLIKRQKFTNSYRQQLDAATTALTNPALDLIVLHMNVPHDPFIYDRATKQFILEKGTYADNIALADQTLGIFRSEMERAGLWERTNVLVTADHGARYNVHRQQDYSPTPTHVPLLLKTMKEPQHLEENTRINLVLIYDLVGALLTKSVQTSKDVSAWLALRTGAQDSTDNDASLPQK